VNSCSRWPGWLLLGALAWHGYDLARTTSLYELLWSCHIATALMALGIFLRVRMAVATPWLFHLSIGLPAWLVAMVLTRGTFGAANIDGPLLATSTLVHVLPIVMGAMWLRRGGFALSWRVAALAWLLQAALIPLTRPFTPPELNINLAHGVYPSLSRTFPNLFVFQVTICLACLASVTIVTLFVNAIFGRREIAIHKSQTAH